MIEPIVPASWVSAHRDELLLCDVRWYLDGRDGHRAYLDGHIPGARFIDLETVLAGPGGPVDGRHPLPDPAVFARGLADAGIGGDSTVVAYDDLGGMVAGRLVWMLRIIGRSAALLDGGVQAWVGDLEMGPVDATPTERVAIEWPPDAMATADEVADQLDRGGVVVDSRAAPRYAGDVEPVDPRAGHVPGAINLPFSENLDDGGRFRPGDELARRFERAGVDEDAVVYCGSGVSACNNVLAIEAAGLGRPRLYVGSWSGWSSDADRPAATGTDPG